MGVAVRARAMPMHSCVRWESVRLLVLAHFRLRSTIFQAWGQIADVDYKLACIVACIWEYVLTIHLPPVNFHVRITTKETMGVGWISYPTQCSVNKHDRKLAMPCRWHARALT